MSARTRSCCFLGDLFLCRTLVSQRARGEHRELVDLCVAMFAVIAVAFITWKRDGLDFRHGSSLFADVATASLGRGRELAEPRCLIPPGELRDPFFCYERPARTCARAPMGR